MLRKLQALYMTSFEGEELIDYLHSKRNGEPLPWNGIIYKDLYGPDAEPWVVFANDFQCYCHNENKGTFTKSTIFVFTKLIRFPQKKSQNNSDRVSRIAGKGTWSSRTKTMKIFRSGTDEIIGVTRMLSFKNQDSGGASQDFGDWTMHEYSLNETTKGAAGDLVVCKITRSVKNNAGSSRRQPPPLFFSPVIANGGSSECIQIARKRPAEECSFQERKVHKCFSNGSAAEVKPPPQLSSPAIACVEEVNEEKPGDDGTFFKALEPKMEPHNGLNSAWDENIEPPYGGTAEAATAIAEDDDNSWLVKALLQDQNTEPPLLEDLYDINVKSCGSLAQAAAAECDPLLQVSTPSALDDHDFDFGVDSFLDDPLQLSSPAIACVEEVNEEKPGDDGTFSKALEPEMEPHNGLNSAWDENIEPPYAGTAEAGVAIAEDDDDSWLVKALLQDQNTEPPLLEDLYDINVKSCGSLAQAAAAECDPLLQVSAPSALDDHDFDFGVDSFLDDPLQVSPPSPGYFDFNTDLGSLFNVEPPLWSYRQ